MKRTVFVLSTMLVAFVAVFAVLVLRPVRKVKAGRGCSDAALYGNYRIAMTGSIDYYDGYSFEPGPWDISMLATFDGKGDFSGSNLFAVFWGSVISTSAESFTGGKYTVYPNCTVTMTIPGGVSVFAYIKVSFNGVVIDTGGDEAVGTAHFGVPWTGTFDAKRVGQGKRNFFD
jgi:hypothetical protein